MRIKMTRDRRGKVSQGRESPTCLITLLDTRPYNHKGGPVYHPHKLKKVVSVEYEVKCDVINYLNK